MSWIKDRLSEPSTWTSAAALVLSVGVVVFWYIDPRALGWTSIIASALAFIGFVGHDKDNKLW